MLDGFRETEEERVILGLLTSVGNNGARSQRHIAAELDIALGLVNAYLKRAVREGFIKVKRAPAHRYAYRLTPKGFSEKSRLTVAYLASAFSFFRKAKTECKKAFEVAANSKFYRIVLAGKSDLCEIAILCAAEEPVQIIAIVDPDEPSGQFNGIKLVADFDEVGSDFDAVLVTELEHGRKIYDLAVERFGIGHVLAPTLLGLSVLSAGAMR